MEFTDNVFRSVLDSLKEQIAIIDSQGTIKFVNHSWIKFGIDNGACQSKKWLGDNYLATCNESATSGDIEAKQASQGIFDVICHKSQHFSFEYPCHSDTVQRWFMMRIVPLQHQELDLFVVTHHNITDRKLAEIKVEQLASLDALTKIANRRKFNEFADNQIKVHIRRSIPLSLAMIDIDHFKQVNDQYGHIVGDECLTQLADILQSYARRPYDICARYGGEEFILLFGETSDNQVISIVEDIRQHIANYRFKVSAADDLALTVSIGVTTVIPDAASSLENVIDTADHMLYKAKNSGRNCVKAKALPYT